MKEDLIVKGVEKLVERGFLVLAILKLLTNRRMNGGEIRRALVGMGFKMPTGFMLYSILRFLKSKGMVCIVEKRGRNKYFMTTQKGMMVYERAIEHLRENLDKVSLRF